MVGAQTSDVRIATHTQVPLSSQTLHTDAYCAAYPTNIGNLGSWKARELEG
jgi:hypothetical protein